MLPRPDAASAAFARQSRRSRAPAFRQCRQRRRGACRRRERCVSVILVDANLLVYAYVAFLSQHARAREWFDEQLNGAAMVGLPWPSLLPS